jgi:hypothetical protein
MFRGHVPAVQDSKARAIVNFKRHTKMDLLCEYVRSQGRPYFLQFLL